MTIPTSDRPLALVTGASSGIGYELAAQFLEHGFDLVIAAEDDGIELAAQKLRRDGGPQIWSVRVDLAREQGVTSTAPTWRAPGWVAARRTTRRRSPPRASPR
ncbi:SDR family NAD(P)-dependent oxidoreductase [Micromonospora sp. NPDC050276]|uniref:SDR family NAD(P)-dependent oxidoreductase n=1 Tax=Micromonospora sp. NPDC050276 TaxID=3364278 RepID=UPI003789C21F